MIKSEKVEILKQYLDNEDGILKGGLDGKTKKILIRNNKIIEANYDKLYNEKGSFKKLRACHPALKGRYLKHIEEEEFNPFKIDIYDVGIAVSLDDDMAQLLQEDCSY